MRAGLVGRDRRAVDERQGRTAGPGSSAATGGPSTSARGALRGRARWPRPAGRRRAPGAHCGPGSLASTGGPSTSARCALRAGLVGLDRRAVDERQVRAAGRARWPRPAGRRRAPGARCGPGSLAATGGPSTSARCALRAGLVGLDRRAVDERQVRAAGRARWPRPAGRRRAPGAHCGAGLVGRDRRAVDERQGRTAGRARRPRPAGRRRAPSARCGGQGKRNPNKPPSSRASVSLTGKT